MGTEPIFYWHIHHGILAEPLAEPVGNRIRFIRENKPAKEVETRLRLMRPVRGKLPAKLAKARQACDEAKRALDEAGRAYADAARGGRGEARRAYEKRWLDLGKMRWALEQALRASRPEIEALHKLECPGCPWDGETIFPNGRTQ